MMCVCQYSFQILGMDLYVIELVDMVLSTLSGVPVTSLLGLVIGSLLILLLYYQIVDPFLD